MILTGNPVSENYEKRIVVVNVTSFLKCHPFLCTKQKPTMKIMEQEW
jgi:hypothetical protein